MNDLNQSPSAPAIHHIVIGHLTDSNIPTTLASAISQLGDADTTVIVTVVIDRGTTPTDPGSDRVHFLEANPGTPIAVRDNLAAYSQPAATTIRFLDDGDILAPTATVDDTRVLRSAHWCASGVADTDGAVIHRRAPGTVPTRNMLDEWAAPTVALSIHPSGVAYTMAAFTALGGFSAVEYAHRTELMARANEHWPGHYRAGAASLTLRPHTALLRDRPMSFGRDRLAITESLLSGRTLTENTPARRSIEQRWDEISDQAWTTHTEGLATTISDGDSLEEVMIQARKLHYRFAWPRLVDYLNSAGTRFRGVDDYLEAMYLTAHAATTQHWDDAIAFTAEHRKHRIIHLLLTAIFESGATSQHAIAAGIGFADLLLELDPADPVAHYRQMSLHRMRGDYPAADQWRRRALDAIAVLPDANLSDHLRERVLAEGPIITAHLLPETAELTSTCS